MNLTSCLSVGCEAQGGDFWGENIIDITVLNKTLNYFFFRGSTTVLEEMVKKIKN